MEFFRVEMSEIADKLDFMSLTKEQQVSLLQGLQHDPETHDLFRVLVAVIERDAPSTWNKRQRNRKRFSLVDRVLVDIRPQDKALRVLGVQPTTTSYKGETQLDIEVQADVKILEVANTNLRFKGPIKNWWRKKRPLVVAIRTDRLAQWVYSRQWIDMGNQCRCEILVEVPKELTEQARKVSCYADFKDSGGRNIEKLRQHVRLA